MTRRSFTTGLVGLSVAANAQVPEQEVFPPVGISALDLYCSECTNPFDGLTVLQRAMLTGGNFEEKMRQRGIWIDAPPKDLDLMSPPERLKKSMLWPFGKIKVQFLDGSKELRAKVLNDLALWTPDTCIQFEQVESDGWIRVKFDANKGNWSKIGTQALKVKDKTIQTLNLSITDTTHPAVIKALVLHEFGHALGMMHEHQHPDSNIPWKEDAVLNYYREKHGWKDEDTRYNVLKKYASNHFNGSSYDAKSIMVYAIPKELRTDSVEIKQTYTLSKLDREWIKKFYPSALPAEPPPK